MYILLAELAWPHKAAALHPFPIQIRNIYTYESLRNPGRTLYLLPDYYYVGTDERHEHIIGLFLNGHMFPFLAHREDLQNRLGRVKLRITGNVANEIVPILDRDPLNRVFKENFTPQNIRLAEIQ